jgi:hypothetical protein
MIEPMSGMKTRKIVPAISPTIEPTSGADDPRPAAAGLGRARRRAEPLGDLAERPR